MLPLLVAAALASAPAPVAPLPSPAAGLAQDEEQDAPRWDEEEDEERERLRITAWGGEALDSGGSGRGSAFVGGEVGWAFESIDLSVSGSGYRNVRDSLREWTPVVLARLTQRFETRRGFEAAFGFGLGAGRPRDWKGWFQVALGVRVPLGPLFLAGELAFEQNDLLRLAAGLGAAF